MTQQGSGRQSVARARITVDTSQFQRAGEVVIRTSQRISEGVQRAATQFQRIGTQGDAAMRRLAMGFQEVERRQRAFANSDFGRVTQGLREAEQAMRGYSLAAGAAVAYGLAQAQNMNRNNALLRVFTGSQERAVRVQSQLRDIAAQTGQAYANVLESAVAILPSVGRYNIDLQRTLSIVQRLGLLDPAQGTQGAAFALREALSGEARSLAARFELPLSQVNAIIDRAAGDPQKIIEGLSDLIDGLGLTQEEFENLQRSGINAFERLKGTVSEAFATAFAPALNNVVIPFAEGFSNLLTITNQLNPQLLQTAATGAIIVAGISPALLVVNNLTQGYVALRAAMSAANLASIGRGLVTPLSIAGGVAAGVAIAQRLADQGMADSRLRTDSKEDPYSVLFDRLKQGSVIITNWFFELVRLFGQQILEVENVLRGLVAVIELGDALIAEAFANFVVSIGNLMTNIGDSLSSIPIFGGAFTTLSGAGRVLSAVGQINADTATSNRNAAQERVSDVFDRTAINQRIDRFNADLDAVKGIATGFVYRLLYPLTEKITQDFETAGEETSSALINIADIFNDNADQLLDAVAEMNKINADAALRDSRLNEDRGIQDSRQNFDDALSRARQLRDFNQGMQESDADFLAGRQRAQADFNAEQAEEDAKAYADRLDQLAEFNLETKRRNEDFGRELVKIQRDTNEAVRTSALKLDASGVSEAYRRGEQRTNEITEQFQIETDRRNEDFRLQMETLTTNLEEQRNQRLTAFQQQQADEWAQYNQQRQRQITAFQQRLADEDFDRVVRRQREIQDRQLADSRELQDRQRRIAGLAVQVGQEIGLWNALQTNVGTALGNIRNGIASIFAINTARPTTSSIGGATSRGITRAIPTFAQGTNSVPTHRPVIVGERGPELAYFTHPARIYSAESSITRNYMSSGGGSGSLLNIESFAPYFGARGVDDMLPELMSFMNSALEQFWQQYAARKGGV